MPVGDPAVVLSAIGWRRTLTVPPTAYDLVTTILGEGRLLEGPVSELKRLFTEHELSLVRNMEAHISQPQGAWARELATCFREGIARLAKIVDAWDSYPPLRERGKLADRERSEATLIEVLRNRGESGFEWVLPTKAVLSRSYGIAKVHFFSSLLYTVRDREEPDARALVSVIQEAVEEAVFTRLAEELYGTFVASADTDQELCKKAVSAAVDLWDGRPHFSTDRFCPVLRSAWSARARAALRFGTLMGASELFELLFRRMDLRFLQILQERFDEDGVVQSFEEFLFELPWENLQHIREEMRRSNRASVDSKEVAEILGVPEEKVRRPEGEPKAMYSSFRRRRLAARHRAAMGLPGPRRTAESYVLEALLRSEA